MGNPEVFKDLGKVFHHLHNKTSMTDVEKSLLDKFVPTLGNTVLVEENPSKCRLQPLNLIPLPEYSEREYHDSRKALSGISQDTGEAIDNTNAKIHSGEMFEQRAQLFRQIFGGEA